MEERYATFLKLCLIEGFLVGTGLIIAGVILGSQLPNVEDFLAPDKVRWDIDEPSWFPYWDAIQPPVMNTTTTPPSSTLDPSTEPEGTEGIKPLDIRLMQGTLGHRAWAAEENGYLKAYFFNLENVEDFRKGKQPKFREVGPYTYRKRTVKHSTTFQENGDVLNFKLRTTYHFDRNMSVGDESNTISTLNSAMYAFWDAMNFDCRKILPDFPCEKFHEDTVKMFKREGNNDIFDDLTVHELLWGYSSILLENLNWWTNIVTSSFKTRYGFMDGMNGTDSKWMAIRTGKDDTSQLGQVAGWDNKRKLRIWRSDDANTIRGTLGDRFPPITRAKDTKWVFAPSICRSLPMEYAGPVNYLNIPLKRYILPISTFAHPTVKKDNQGYCPDTNIESCLPHGFLHVSECYYCTNKLPDVGLAASMPHHLGSWPWDTAYILGLDPKPEKHQSFIDVDPVTGFTMRSAEKLQLNIYMKQMDFFSDREVPGRAKYLDFDIPQGAKIPKNMMFPMVWFDQSTFVELDPTNKGTQLEGNATDSKMPTSVHVEEVSSARTVEEILIILGITIDVIVVISSCTWLGIWYRKKAAARARAIETVKAKEEEEQKEEMILEQEQEEPKEPEEPPSDVDHSTSL